MNTIDYFKAKESGLILAMQRIESKLLFFKNESAKIEGNWTDADREKLKLWNNWHDLQYRIEERIKDNWSNYKAWHWQTFGFNTYP